MGASLPHLGRIRRRARTATSALVRHPSGAIRVYSTHFGSPWDTGAVSRRDQARKAFTRAGIDVSRTIVIKGRVMGSTTVELEQALPERIREVQVVAQVPDESGGRLSDYLRGLPPGTRTQEDIDRQIRQEGEAWS